jgi:hypothetical protein
VATLWAMFQLMYDNEPVDAIGAHVINQLRQRLMLTAKD